MLALAVLYVIHGESWGREKQRKRRSCRKARLSVARQGLARNSTMAWTEVRHLAGGRERQGQICGTSVNIAKNLCIFNT